MAGEEFTSQNQRRVAGDQWARVCVWHFLAMFLVMFRRSRRPLFAWAFCLCAITAGESAECPSSVDSRLRSRPVGPLLDGLRNGCASGLATVCAKAMLQPFDTIKTLQQANTGKIPHGMLQTATALVNERGVGSLYRGMGVALLGSVPAMCAPPPTVDLCQPVSTHTAFACAGRSTLRCTRAASARCTPTRG